MSVLSFGFRHRPSRWERIRDRMSGAGDLRDHLPDRDRLRDLRDMLPDRGELRDRVQPLISRAGGVRPDISLSDLQAFVQERASAVPRPGVLRAQSRRRRFLDAEAPLWLVLAAAVGGLAIGFMAAKASSGRAGAIAAEEFEAAAEQIKSAWPTIDDTDIRDARGDIRRLSSVIGERTGEDTARVRERLGTITTQGHSSNGNDASA